MALNYQDVTPTQLAQAELTTGYVTLYTVPTNTRTYLKDIDIANTTASTLTVSVSVVPSAGSPGAGNALLFGVSVPANGTLQWTGTQIMNMGGTLSAKASAAGLTLTASGGEAK